MTPTPTPHQTLYVHLLDTLRTLQEAGWIQPDVPSYLLEYVAVGIANAVVILAHDPTTQTAEDSVLRSHLLIRIRQISFNYLRVNLQQRDEALLEAIRSALQSITPPTSYAAEEAACP